jgi:hypothetical protein
MSVKLLTANTGNLTASGVSLRGVGFHHTRGPVAYVEAESMRITEGLFTIYAEDVFNDNLVYAFGPVMMSERAGGGFSLLALPLPRGRTYDLRLQSDMGADYRRIQT